MVDELRKDHDPRANAEERQWMAVDFYGALSRFVLVAGLAIMLGVSAAVLTDRYASTPTMASAK